MPPNQRAMYSYHLYIKIGYIEYSGLNGSIDTKLAL